VDADAYGVLGRERIWGATRWTAAAQNTPAYQALLLYRNANGAHLGFQNVSVEATQSASASLFSVYAATDPIGTTMTLMVVNKDPVNTANVSFNVSGFKPTTMKTYTLSSAKPTAIVAGTSKNWSSTQSFAPYSATLIVATGSTQDKIAAEWDLNPDTIAAPSSSTVTIAPAIVSGTGTVRLTAASAATGLGVTLTQPKLGIGSNGLVTIKTPSAPGLYRFAVAGVDANNTPQEQFGWVIVGNAAATLTKTGDNQSASRGKPLTLTATFVPGSSGASAGNVSILFTTSAGTLSSKVVRTGLSGQATVTLTLPSTPGKVTVTARAPIPWGGARAVFTETAQ